MAERSAGVAPEVARDLDVIRGGGDGGSPPKRRRGGRAFVLLAAAVLAVGAYSLRDGAQAPPQARLVAVTLREVNLPGVKLAATGYLVPRRQITVSSKVQGRILEMPVVENQQVEVGELIARIEGREQQAHLRLAEAEAAQTKNGYRRAAKLHELGAVPTAELERAATALEVAEARLELANVAVEQTTLVAPMAGTIIRKLRDVGEFLTIGVTASGDPGTAVVTLADLGAMSVALEIAETEIGSVSVGDVALVAPESLPENRYLADVTEIAAMADRRKGMVAVKVRIREPDASLLPDMTARVSMLEHEPERAVVVRPTLPQSAVSERDGRSVVFTLDGTTVAEVEVEIEDVGDGYVALLSGPEEGSYVLDAPPTELRAGQDVALESP